MQSFEQFEVLTFDCYGTLIDWETGILNALRPVLQAHEIDEDNETLLQMYARLESAAEKQGFRPYREILQSVMDGFGREFGVTFGSEERACLVHSLPAWPPFPDTVESLRKLKSRFRLAVISNVDDDLFARTAEKLQVPFDWVITAQQVGSYKPSLRNFRRAIEVMGVPRQKILHVAQSLYHDIAPAQKLGLSTVWVDRRRGKGGTGATPPADARPDLIVASLSELVDLIFAEADKA